MGASSATRRRREGDQLAGGGRVVAQLDHGDAAGYRLADHALDAAGAHRARDR